MSHFDLLHSTLAQLLPPRRVKRLYSGFRTAARLYYAARLAPTYSNAATPTRYGQCSPLR